jgi:alkylhydroperoxidase family enzyme
MRIRHSEGWQPTLPFALAPEIVKAASEFCRATYACSRLSLREFEAARMVTARINGCQICQNWRSSVELPLYLKSLGGDPSQSVVRNGEAPGDSFYEATADWRHSDMFSARERVAMEMAEGMGLSPHELAADEDFWGRAHAAFDDAEIVDLTYSIGCWIALGRVTHVLGLDSVCGLPSRRAAEALVA